MDFSATIDFFLGQLGKLVLSLGSHFSATSLAAALVIAALFFAWQRVKRGRRLRWRVHRARAVPQAHRAAQVEPRRHRLSAVQRVPVRHRVRLGRAHLSGDHQHHHHGAGLDLRPGRAVDLAALRLARRRHCLAVPRLRARLLVQSLAQPQGAVLVGIPQSASHGGSAHADHQLPRPSGLFLDLRQYPGVLGGGRRRPRQLSVRQHQLPIRHQRHQYDPGALHPHLRAFAAFAHVDRVHRRARPHLRVARASSGASLGQSEALQQELRQLSGAVGLDVRHALCAGEKTRAAQLRLSRPHRCAHVQGRSDRSGHQRRRATSSRCCRNGRRPSFRLRNASASS